MYPILRRLWQNQPNRWSIAFEFAVLSFLGILVMGVVAWFGSLRIVHQVLTETAGRLLDDDQIGATVQTLRDRLLGPLALASIVCGGSVYLLMKRASYWLDRAVDHLVKINDHPAAIEIPGGLDEGVLAGGSEVLKLLYTTNNLTTDLTYLNRQVEAIADGELDSEILDVNVSGRLGKSFRHMVVQLKELNNIARIIAREELSHPLLDRERKGSMAASHQEMIRRLRLLHRQAEAIAQGRLSDKILDEVGEGELSRTFHSMTANLKLVARQTEAVARKDLSSPSLHETLAGEVGNSLARMFGVLEDLVKVSQKTIVHLATSSRELAALSTNQKEMAAQQADSTARTSTTFQELSVNSAHVVANVEQVLQAATRMVKGCQETQERSQALLSILEETISVGEDNMQRVRRLEESSRKIVGVTSIIGELANETRVLGVNAAIMAAQAGEDAGGFTVVAREIRRLATKTVGATREIKDYVLGIQKSIQDVVKSTSSVQDRSREGGLKARESTQTMEELLGISSQVKSSSQSIASNIKAQQVTIEDVVAAVRTMDETAGSFSMTASEIHNLASHLRDSSEELNSLIQEFKV